MARCCSIYEQAEPIAVPVGIIEAFFLGQGPANLPGGLQRAGNGESRRAHFAASHRLGPAGSESRRSAIGATAT